MLRWMTDEGPSWYFNAISFEKNKVKRIIRDFPLIGFKQFVDKLAVFIRINFVQFYGLRTGENGTFDMMKHLREQVGAAAAENKAHIFEFLNLRAQHGFDIFFGILGDLLKLVHRHHDELILAIKE